jgi:adenosylcobyric acid synthase
VQEALFGRRARGLEEALDALADALERHLDLKALHRALGLTGKVHPASRPLQAPDPPPPPRGAPPLGGARSGKSRLAQRLAGPFATLIATAEARDEEMAERIAHHRRERPPTWETLEEPLDLVGALGRARHGVVVVDCLTLWVANLLEAGLDPLEEAERFLQAVEGSNKRVIAVSNEVGMGIVPANPLARRYRDLLGEVNARFAQRAKEAYLLVAGRALPLAPPTP